MKWKAILKDILSCIILKKKWSVINKLFPINCIFLYISSWSKVLEFYLMSFFNMESWSLNFRNFLDDFQVHYGALFINRTINNNYMTLLMVLHHTHDGFWYLFYTRASLIPGTLTLPTLNLSIKSHPSSGTCVFPEVTSVSNYHSFNEKTIKLLNKISNLICHEVCEIPHKTYVANTSSLQNINWLPAS